MVSSDEEIVPRRQTVKIKPRVVPPKSRRVISVLSDQVSSSPQASTQIDSKKTRKRTSSIDDEEDSFFTRKIVFVPRNTPFSKTCPIKDSVEFEQHEENCNAIPHEHRGNKKGKTRIDWMKPKDSIIDLDDLIDKYVSDDDSDEISELLGKVKRKESKGSVETVVEELIERELTPPPDPDRNQFQSTMNALQQTLTQYSESLRATTIADLSILDSSKASFEIDLDPELRAISENTAQSLQIKTNRPFNMPARRSLNDKVEILLKALRHPLLVITEQNRAFVSDFEKPMKFILMASNAPFYNTNIKSDTFEQMFSYFCQKKSIGKNELVVTFNNIKVFPRGTPMSLNITGEVVMEACTKQTHEYIRQQKEIQQQQKLKQLEQMLVKEELMVEGALPLASVNDNGEEFLHFKLQSKDGSIEKLRVKKTTTVQAIINRYREIKHISETALVRLIFEGESLDPSDILENTELEDGDMLSVKGPD
ncbi:hypothetical protein G9A89_019227 [Geosiphon pyriformis]|nr:hypothetical protein G9A89_019227 [Geosiphon pyriformis]